MPTATYIYGKGLRNKSDFKYGLKKWDHVIAKISIYSYSEKQPIKGIIIGVLGDEVLLSPIANRAKPFRVNISSIIGFWEPKGGLNQCGGYCEKHKSIIFRK